MHKLHFVQFQSLDLVVMTILWVKVSILCIIVLCLLCVYRCTVPTRYTFGDKLELLYNGKVVARGDAVESGELHGKPMPISFQKVVITSVIDNHVNLMLTSTFDESPYISLGKVVTWPLKKL